MHIPSLKEGVRAEHEARVDAGCVLHTHTRDGVAFRDDESYKS